MVQELSECVCVCVCKSVYMCVCGVCKRWQQTDGSEWKVVSDRNLITIKDSKSSNGAPFLTWKRRPSTFVRKEFEWSTQVELKLTNIEKVTGSIPRP